MTNLSQTRPHVRRYRLHVPLCLTVIAIAALGCYNLHSAAAHHLPRLWLTQLSWFALGAFIVALALSVDYRVTEALAYPIYTAVVSLLVLVLVAGKSAMGAKRWLALGPMVFQPSELAKVALIFGLARYFCERIKPVGYSIYDLTQPLNISRPMFGMVLLYVAWDKPWLVDPLGVLARGVHGVLGQEPPPLENLLWFRVTCISGVLLGSGAIILVLLRIEKKMALLNPWPKGRRRRLCIWVALLGLSGIAAVVSCWHHAAMADPFGVALQHLDRAAQIGGRYHTQHNGTALRLIFLALGLVYVLASIIDAVWRPKPVIDRLVAPVDLLAAPGLLTLVQPDLGTSGIIFLIGMTMVLIVGVRFRSLCIMSVMSAAFGAVAWFGVLKDYQKRRILTFLDPEQDVRGAGWNAVQSLIAVGSGRWSGKGHMNGTQTQLSFLPEQHTDFAFSVWAEEQGFLGCVVLVALYLVVTSLAFGIAMRARDAYGTLLATGVTALILWQAVINMGMVIGVLPVVGITLPLFSYGGSSVLTIMLSLGLLLNVHWRRRA